MQKQRVSPAYRPENLQRQPNERVWAAFLRPKAEISHPAILHNAIAAQNESIQILPVCLWEFYENFKHLPKIAVQKCKSGKQGKLKQRQICIFSKPELANEILTVCKMQGAMHLLKLKLAFLTPD